MTQRFAPCSRESRRVVGMRELLDHQRRRGDQARDSYDRKDLAQGQLPVERDSGPPALLVSALRPVEVPVVCSKSIHRGSGQRAPPACLVGLS